MLLATVTGRGPLNQHPPALAAAALSSGGVGSGSPRPLGTPAPGGHAFRALAPGPARNHGGGNLLHAEDGMRKKVIPAPAAMPDYEPPPKRGGHLCLVRRLGQSIVLRFGDLEAEVKLDSLTRLGDIKVVVRAPREVVVLRSELVEREGAKG